MGKKIAVYIYKDEFGSVQRLLTQTVVVGTVRQLSNDNYLLPAFLLDVPLKEKYPDGSQKRKQWIMQGAKLFVSASGFHLRGFVPENDHEADEVGPFRRTEWMGPLNAIE